METSLAYFCRAEGSTFGAAKRSCFAGLDLSSTTDITALVLVFPDNDRYEVLPFFWVPEENARKRERRDRVPYGQWITQGLIEATPGEAIDYDFNLPPNRRLPRPAKKPEVNTVIVCFRAAEVDFHFLQAYDKRHRRRSLRNLRQGYDVLTISLAPNLRYSCPLRRLPRREVDAHEGHEDEQHSQRESGFQVRNSHCQAATNGSKACLQGEYGALVVDRSNSLSASNRSHTDSEVPSRCHRIGVSQIQPKNQMKCLR